LAVAWRITRLIELGGHGPDLNAQWMFKPAAQWLEAMLRLKNRE